MLMNILTLQHVLLNSRNILKMYLCFLLLLL